MGLKNNPKIVAIPKGGKTMIDKFGNRAIVHPDGTVEELTGKTAARQAPEEATG